MPSHSPISLWLSVCANDFVLYRVQYGLVHPKKLFLALKRFGRKSNVGWGQCMGSPMQCARLYGAKIDGDEEVNWYEHQKSQQCWPSTTTKSSTAWRTSYKCKNNIESPLDLWTVSKRFRTNCYLVATSLEKGSKCNFNKKKGCMSRALEIQEYSSCWKVHTSTVHPTLSSQSSQGQNIFRNIHLFPSHH